MRILTLWQPWASLIAHGLKRYETRSWATLYRGKLAIHSAQRRANDGEVEAIYNNLRAHGGSSDDLAKLDQVFGCFLMSHDDLPYGAIVAISDLTDCEKMLPSVIQTKSLLERAVGNWAFDRFAWKLENIVALPEPIPCKGGQGLRRLTDDSILEKIQEVIEL